jgi:hypothetical protein
MGDVDLDQRVSSPDAVHVLRRQEQLPLPRGVDPRRGDVDGDGRVLGLDARAILRALVGMPVDTSTIVGLSPIECPEITRALFGGVP